MSPDLKQELKQEKPFRSIHQEAELNLARTANLLSDNFERLVKPYGITGTQYNVLRILRGAEPNGLCRNEVSGRLLNRMPDATRLLDRMEEAGLVTRARSTEDRRLVTTRITQMGLALENPHDHVSKNEQNTRLGHLSDNELRTLIELLTSIRNAG